MTWKTSDGDWTLVLSYSFTKYSHFRDRSNAITPRTNWPVWFDRYRHVPVSTTPSLNETDYNAVNFSLRKNSADPDRSSSRATQTTGWCVCDPRNGSVVDWQEGYINCSIIKHVTGPSHELVPSRFSPNQNNSYGPLLCMTKRYNSTNYYFDGHTENHRPTHDPLGGNSPNQKKNVANPHANIFIRVE